MFGRFPFTRQIEINDCGAACLNMLCRHFGKYIDIELIRKYLDAGRHGASVYDFVCAAERLKLKCQSFKITFDDLKDDVPLPCVVLWCDNHFIVVHKITRHRVFVADPASGLLSYSIRNFKKAWLNNRDNEHAETGVCIVCEPTAEFHEIITKTRDSNYLEAWNYVKSYLNPYKRQILQIILVLLAITVLNALVPMVTQSIVDSGIPRQDGNYINIMLAASISLGVGIALGSWLQQVIGLYFALRVKVSIIADYIARMFKMPIEFFESRTIGTILQRNYDFDRIESMLLSALSYSVLSILLIILFGTLMLIYNAKLFWVYLIGSSLYISWVLLFWSVRKKMDINYYTFLSRNQCQWIEFITNISDIKCYNYGGDERRKWEKIQVGLFKTRVKLLNVDQLQNVGTSLIASIRDALLLFLSAKSVVDGEMSLGMLAAVLYIVGQMRAPIEGIVNFIVTSQLFFISYGRITDVFKSKGENVNIVDSNDDMLTMDNSLQTKGVYFKYSANGPYALNNVSILFPAGKTTAIVGSSGSGKSTLIKVLARLYSPVNGNVCIGNTQLDSISIDFWRKKIGVVTQESNLINDTIFNNIVFGRTKDSQKVLRAVKIASIQWEIETMPLGYDTVIGEKGKGVSEGQKQRILLARAIYDEPEFLMLDELTSSLDARNEDLVMKSLKEAMHGKTLILSAHRLSTILMADYIVVMKSGLIVDAGTHEYMLSRKKEYYNIFKSQIENAER